ncbi:MAG: histidine triad nucleotide-binding protein [Clostridia bacterium]|nr:histidine triad nucleotide-binding protein [Clostridia bacterium]
MDNCIFCKIIAGDIPSDRVYEDEDMIIIRDINPQAPVHLLLIPKEHYADITCLNAERAATLGRCLNKLQDIVGNIPQLKDGFRLINNKGEFAGQTVGHMHVHILGGTAMGEGLL